MVLKVRIYGQQWRNLSGRCDMANLLFTKLPAQYQIQLFTTEAKRECQSRGLSLSDLHTSSKHWATQPAAPINQLHA